MGIHFRRSDRLGGLLALALLSGPLGCQSESPPFDQARFAEGEESLAFVAAPSRAAPPSQVAAESMPTTMLIRTGAVHIEVGDLQAAVTEAETLVTHMGGRVMTQDVQVGESGRRRAQIVARVPADRFDDAISGLTPIGDVQAVNVQSQDVGEEYVDVQAQARNRRVLEERLLDLLATRAGNLEEVLAVERELARVREDIERREGRLNYLRNQVEFSTLTIFLHEPRPLFSGDGGRNVFVEAFGSAWRNFIGFTAMFIASLGVLIPLALLSWLGWATFRRVRRRRSNASALS
jgi:hypothetical protein